MAEFESGKGYGADQRLPSELDKNRLPGDPAISEGEAKALMQPQPEYTPTPDDLPPHTPTKVAPLPEDRKVTMAEYDRALPKTEAEVFAEAGVKAKAILNTVDLKSPKMDDGLPPHNPIVGELPPHDPAAEAARFEKDLPK
jgi:hypothetical protein